MKQIMILLCLALCVPLCWSADKSKEKSRCSPSAAVPISTSATLQCGKRVLSDEEMDEVSAGAATAQMNGNVLSFAGQTANGNVSGSGTVEVKNAAEQNATSGVLVLQDAAQSGSKSFIGINAVNSQIQVLVNLNININSSVGTLHQANLTGK